MMADKSLDFTSQELTDLPEFIFEKVETEILLLDFNYISVIPLDLCNKLTHLTCLSLNGNTLKSIPEGIGMLTSLSELYLKENLLCDLPSDILKLENLQKFHLTGNQIKYLPEHFSCLQNLSEFIADENEIEKLPSDFGLLQNLTYLELSYNNIRELPDTFGNLTSLKEISISNNLLRTLPQSFQDLSCVEVIDLSHNGLLELPENFASAGKLVKLLLSSNSIVMIPQWFSRLSKIKEIDLNSNALQDSPFPEDFGFTSDTLELLDVRGNAIRLLPSSFGNLVGLKKLHLGTCGEPERKRTFSSGNCIIALPSSFVDLSNLTVLELDENNIAELPTDFGRLSNVVYLNISHNDLQRLPDSFCDLGKLQVCLLSINFITHLPENFGNLSSLEELRLDENLLVELPQSFENLSNLVTLDLFHNKLKEIPSCLQNLQNLKTLDLKENYFDINLDNIPDFHTSARYLVRNPELKDNWRGRKREDISDGLWVNNNEQIEGRDKETDVLTYALKYSTSLWKSHGDDGVRKTHHRINGHLNETNEAPLSDGSANNTSEDAYNSNLEEEECWDSEVDDTFGNTSELRSGATTVAAHNGHYFENSSDSDWEDDTLKKITTFKKIYMHPVKTELAAEFVPSDLHAKHIPRPEMWDFVEDGQFDDDDEDL